VKILMSIHVPYIVDIRQDLLQLFENAVIYFRGKKQCK